MNPQPIAGTTPASPCPPAAAGATGARPLPHKVGFGQAFRAEWGKAWSIRSTWWSALGSLVLMAGCAATLANDATHSIRTGEAPPAITPLADILAPSAQLAQFALIAMALQLVTSEYSSGGIRATLQAQPRRWMVLLAKTLVVAVTAAPLSAVLGLAGTAVAVPLLGEYGSVDIAEVGEVVARVTVYLVLVAVLTVGTATALRSAVGTLSTVLVLLVGLLVISSSIGDYLPAGAGANLLVGSDDPYSVLVVTAILAGWALLSLIVGHEALRRRDA